MQSLNTLLEYGNPALISRNLRTILFEYIEDELTIGATSCFTDLLPELNYLFNFLDEAANVKLNPLAPVTKKHAAVEDENCAPLLFNDELLYRVTVFLASTLQPERIYCLQHQSITRQQPLTDLLIVLPRSMQEQPFSQYETLVEAGSAMGTQLYFSLHHASRVDAALEEGHLFYSFVCTKENLLYWKEQKEWPVTSVQRKQELAQVAVQRFQNNFCKAQSFLQYAVESNKQLHNQLTAFFLQQAAELCCRAILIACTGFDKKTHSITVLKKTCRRCTAIVEQVFPNKTEEEKRLLKLLDDAYIAARYEDHFSPAAADLELLLQKVELLHQLAPPAVNERFTRSD